MSPTPRPWKYSEYISGTDIVSRDGRTCCFSSVYRHDEELGAAESRAIAAFIVRAVNSYDAMLEACQLAFDCLDRKSRAQQQWTGSEQRAFEKLQDALVLSVQP